MSVPKGMCVFVCVCVRARARAQEPAGLCACPRVAGCACLCVCAGVCGRVRACRYVPEFSKVSMGRTTGKGVEGLHPDVRKQG